MAEDFPDDLRYTESDEWIRQEGDLLTCGITQYASDQLGDVVYVKLPKPGLKLGKDDPYGEVESVKAVSDLNAPVAGEIVEANSGLDQNAGLVNEDPYGKGWIIKMRPDNPADYDTLLDAASYEKSTKERD